MRSIIWSGKSILIMTIALFAATAGAAVNIIPKPNSLTEGSGTFTVPATVIISADGQSTVTAAWLQQLFSRAGVPTQLGSSQSAHIIVSLDGGLSNLGPEGYTLNITATNITISSSTLAGQFYAVQTLRQLLPPEVERGPTVVQKPITVPVVAVSDKPRFVYRGSMLDVARHFLPMSYLRQHVDRMALFKLNRLHLHLTDDQGWRFEMKSFPTLTSIGGKTQVGGAQGDFFYTQSEMSALIKYAQQRNVVIVPEFDMPGHSGAMFVSLPRLAGCSNPDLANGKIYTGIQTNWSSLCVGGYGPAATRAYTDSVISVIFKEVCAFFPGEYINIGGDEADPTQGTPFITFIQQMETLFSGYGKKMIGWEEVGTAKKLATTWTIAWNKTGAGDVNSNCEYQFIDHPNKAGADPNAMTWCATQVTLQNVYNTPMTSANKGVQSCLFSEYVTDLSIADKRAFPRTVATAEVGWAATNNNWTEFRTRITPFGKRFDAMGIQFFSTDGSWDRGTTYTTASSVYDNFDPSITAVVVLNKHHVPPAKWNASGKIFDLRGREICVMNSRDIQSKNVQRRLSQGIYFIIEDTDNSVQKSTVRMLIRE